MAGQWFGIEILEHVDKGRPAVDSCIRMEIKEVDSNNVELIWRERNFEVIYKFVILNPNSRGVWTSQGSQTGERGGADLGRGSTHENALALYSVVIFCFAVTGTSYGYTQFAGNVYVLKASESNIVLTFCSKPHVLYSLVLTKKHTMNETELSSVHSMVNRFGAPIPVEIKKYCRNHATDTATASVALLLVLCIISMFTNMLRGR